MYGKSQLVFACVAMFSLTIIVALRMFKMRVDEMRAKRIHPQAVSTSVQMASKIESIQAADNYRNLFEMPVLFYVLCCLLISLEMANVFFAATAWLYVIFRYLHSYIHCTSNKVMHRFKAFAASVLILFIMWCGFAVNLLNQ